MSFDYIIVGSGSAGAVIANRLIQFSNVTVLLLEAGSEDSNPKIHTPGNYQDLLGTELDWCYSTEEEPYLENRRIPIARGKVLGGCSSINAMIYIRGNKSDYDRWSSLGNTGWSYQELLPLFYRLENSLSGSITPKIQDNLHPLSQHFLNAAIDFGFSENKNFNDNEQCGVGVYQTTIKNKKRNSVVNAFLNPIRDSKRLHIETNAMVTKIIFKDKHATSVVYQKDGIEYFVEANREIILSAGAFNTPKLLMISGIGSAETLNQYRIPMISNLPGVGHNLHDHLCINTTYKSKLSSAALTSNGCETGIFLQTKNYTGSAPNLQIDAVLDIKAEQANNYYGPTLTFCPILLNPKSRGYVTLSSSDPNAPPIIRVNYLQEESDIQPLIEGIKISRHLGNSHHFNNLLGSEISPGEKIKSDAELENFIKNYATTLWHPVGTCRMGVDINAVVSPELKVHGVSGLRVADASIMPTITSGNTHAPCLLIGEKCASLILNKKIP